MSKTPRAIGEVLADVFQEAGYETKITSGHPPSAGAILEVYEKGQEPGLPSRGKHDALIRIDSNGSIETITETPNGFVEKTIKRASWA